MSLDCGGELEYPEGTPAGTVDLNPGLARREAAVLTTAPLCCLSNYVIFISPFLNIKLHL